MKIPKKKRKIKCKNAGKIEKGKRKEVQMGIESGIGRYDWIINGRDGRIEVLDNNGKWR